MGIDDFLIQFSTSLTGSENHLALFMSDLKIYFSSLIHTNFMEEGRIISKKILNLMTGL